jgi:hypothetical protein
MRGAHRSSAFAALIARHPHPTSSAEGLPFATHTMEMTMSNFTKVTAALVLGFALAGASPVLAAQRTHHSGHDARAQAVQSEQGIPGAEGVTGARAKAIQDCMGTSGRFAQHSWGNTQVQVYRSCMNEHGEVE